MQGGEVVRNLEKTVVYEDVKIMQRGEVVHNLEKTVVPSTITVATHPYFTFLTAQLRKKHEQLFKLRGSKKCNLTLQPCPCELAQLVLQMCGAANSAHTVRTKEYHKLDAVFGQGWNRVEQQFKEQVDSIINVTQAVKVNYDSSTFSLNVEIRWELLSRHGTKQ